MSFDTDFPSEDGLTITQRYSILTATVIAGGIYYNRNDILAYARSIRPGNLNFSTRAREAVADLLERGAAFVRDDQTERAPAATALAGHSKRASSRPSFGAEAAAETEADAKAEAQPSSMSSPNVIIADTTASSMVKSKPRRRQLAPLPSPPPTRSPSMSPPRSASPTSPSVDSQTSAPSSISLASVRSISLAATKQGGEDAAGADEESASDREGGDGESAAHTEDGWETAVTKTAIKKAAKARREAEEEIAKAGAEGVAETDRSEVEENGAPKAAVLPKTEETQVPVTAPKEVNGAKATSGLPTTPNPFAALPVSRTKLGKQNRRKKH